MSHPYKIVIIGNGTLASRGLSALLDFAEVPLVIADSHDDGRDSWRESLVGAAKCLGFIQGKTLLQPSNPNSEDTLRAIKNVAPDIILSLQCPHIIRKDLFSIPPAGTYNLHNAPLPLLRGCDPFSWAIHDGLQTMGVTLHQILDEGIDNGPIVAQRLWEISNDQTAWDLYLKALDEAVILLKKSFSSQLPKPIPQQAEWSTYHPMLQFDFSTTLIEWNTVADTLSAWIRSRVFPPIQLPKFTFGKTSFAEILSCKKVNSTQKKPGRVDSIYPLVISAKWGGIHLIKVKYEGEEFSGEKFAERVGLTVGCSL